MGEEFPKPLTNEVVRAADVVITMGCGDACPIFPGKRTRIGISRTGQRGHRDRSPDPDEIERAPSAHRRAAPRLSVPLARLLAAEFVGTFALVFAGAGAIMVDAKTGALGHVGVAFSFGLVIMARSSSRAHLGSALQRRGHLRLRAQPPLPLEPRRRVLGGPARGRDRGRALLRGSLGASPTSARFCPRARRRSRSSGSSC